MGRVTMVTTPEHSAVAIIGLSCRFPGAASAAEYWQNLCDGIESISFFSDSALLAAGVDPSLVANPNYVKAAPMLRDVEMFDASFFGYSPRDAALMDPQQRLFLEVCWEAFEDAGYDPSACPGRVGVLSAGGGVVSSYLLAKLHHEGLPGQTASIAHINNDKDFLSTRVAFKLNLKGPSFTIQSACSSSLVAVHQACQALRIGESDLMLVGASVVRVPQVDGYLAEKRNLHSLDGHCRPFDAVGQGTIFGSGVGAVLLKPLDRALAERDHIYAVIKGTAANNDGSSKASYTAPSLGQQSQAIADALERAGVCPDSVGYIECHSTGTIVGDPLEIEALSMAFRTRTERKQFCAIGSVKANIGHPEQAAGIAGLIKTALVLHHKTIPPSINYDKPNPSIDFASSPFYVNTRLSNFTASEAPRRAGLNSLGIGGTNVFAVLEQAPSVAQDWSPDPRPCLLTLSAKSADALIARVEQFQRWLNDNANASLGDVCYTTNMSRSQFAFRFAVPARSAEQLTSQLATWLEAVNGPAQKPRQAERAPIAFMFSGQGSQYAGMAAQLYRTHAVFRDVMDRCNALARPQLEHDLLDVIFARGVDEALINRTEYTQPALLAVECALAELLKSWGIEADAVIGHSLGEIAAACVANVMSLEDAMRLAIARGALMQRLPGGGAMVAVMAPDCDVRPIIDAVAPGVEIAAMNGPLNTVVSGERDTLQKLLEELDRRGVTSRELPISNGFHSARTEPILGDLERVAAAIRHSPPAVPFVSNLTGHRMSDAPGTSYWSRHLREGVRFGAGMLALSDLRCGTYLEVGSHPVLLPMAQACLQQAEKPANWVATLVRRQSDAESMTNLLVALYLAGHTLEWSAIHCGSQWRRISLPTYPFQRKRHWIDSPGIANTRIDTEARVGKPAAESSHPLLGQRIGSSSDSILFEARYGSAHIPYLSDHRVAGTVVLPTTVELEAALAIGRSYFGTARVSVDHAMHHNAMSFADGNDRLVRVSANPLSPGRASFTIASAAQDSDEWRTHMTGTLRTAEAGSIPRPSAGEVRARCPHTFPVSDLYDRLAGIGLEYGPRFRGVRDVYLGQQEALTRVQLPSGLADAHYVMHPCLLDACLHAYPLVIDGGADAINGRDRSSAILPISLQGYRCYRDGVDRAWVHTRLRRVGSDGTQLIDICAYDDAGRVLAELDGLAVQRLPLHKVRRPWAEAEPQFYQLAWRKSDATRDPRGRAVPASWMIFADAKGIGAALAARMEAIGHHCHLIYRGDALTRQGPRTWTVNEREPQDFRRLLEQCAAVEGLACEGVVYTWALDAPSMTDLSLATLRNASEIICRGALAILHAVAETRVNTTNRRRFWLLTENSQRIDPSRQDIEPVQAPLWGLGRTIALEYPAVWGGLIDLQSNDRGPDIDALMTELLCPDGETQVAISAQRGRHVARLVNGSLADFPERAPRVRPDATYLVTGGLGMLGRNMAEWLIGKGAKHLVLTGRNPTAKAERSLANSMRRTDAAIHVVACDISREDDVAGLMRWLSDELPPLRGVVHSAGVLDDGILAQLDWDRFAPLFKPRVFGSWLLHHYTRSLALDFFIVNSSLLSLLGSAGQANYTASSAFLDSLVAHRRAAGLCAMTVNWCAWSEGGLATVSGARGEAMWSSLGHAFISPEAAMRAFDTMMHRDVDQIAIAVADWKTYARNVGAPSFLSEVSAQSAAVADRQVAARTVAPNLAVTADAGARRQLMDRLRQHITIKLGFTDLVDPDHRLNELGVDSLMSVTLSNSLESEFGIPVPVAEIISGPTINQLFDAVFQELLQASSATESHHPGGNVHSTDLTFAGTGVRQAPDNVSGLPPAIRQGEVVPVTVRSPPRTIPVTSINGISQAQNRSGASSGPDRVSLLAHLQRRVMEELGFAEPIALDQKLNEIGLDSLRSVTLSNRLEQDLGFPIPVAELIAGPSLNQLLDYLVGYLVQTKQGHSVLSSDPADSTSAIAMPVGMAEVIDPSRPSMVFEVSGTSGGKGLNIRLGADVFPDGSGLRNGGARNGPHPDSAANGVPTPFAAMALGEPDTSSNSISLDGRYRPRDKGEARDGPWLIAPRPNPGAAVRLFCFPYAGGGVASFRAWPQLAHDSLEIVAVEPPGRGTRIHEAAIEDLDTFVQRLLPELVGWLDRPSAFFGHCLGGLTMYATLCALPESSAHFVRHSFACGIRPPHLLRRKGTFEDNLAYRMMLHQAFDIRVPPYAQNDELFADIVRQFDTPAADRMLAIPKLRKLLLPSIRAEFGMAFNYRYRASAPFRFPIASFVGTSDPWVSESDSAGWGDLTRGGFTNHVRAGSHFLMVDDQDYILETINKTFVEAALHE